MSGSGSPHDTANSQIPDADDDAAAQSSHKVYMIGIGLALMATALFSTKPVLIKLIYRYDVDSASLLGLRMLFSLPFFLIIGARAWQEKRATTPLSPLLLIKVSLVGITGYYGASYLDLEGLRYVSSQLERLIIFSYPLMVSGLAFLFLKERLTRATLVGFACSYLGIGLIFGHDLTTFGADVMKGTLYLLASAFVFALYMLMTKTLVAQIGSRLFTSIAMTAASLAILIHITIVGSPENLLAPWPALILAAIIAVFGTVVPSYMINEAIHRLGASRTAIISTFGPAMTSFMAILILGEAFTTFHGAGLLLVMFGLHIATRKH